MSYKLIRQNYFEKGKIGFHFQRIRPQLNIKTKEYCTSCNGTGFITASILVSDNIENAIDYLFTKQNEKSLTLNIHPYLAAYFTKGLFSIRMKWIKKYHRWVKITTDTSLGINEFDFYGKNNNVIKMNSQAPKTNKVKFVKNKAVVQR